MGLRSFLDRRLGLTELGRRALDEPIPGGARFVYVAGSTLTLLFALQIVTGVAIAIFYSPSVTSAWASVDYLMRVVPGGTTTRALHHFGASAMVIFLIAHLLQTALFGASRPPREVTWWSGLTLLGLVLAFCLTGYLLPWDQKGYWATRVATGIAGSLPFLGDWLERELQGGNGYGNLTLTRFYAVHVLLLPGLALSLIALHLWAFRRHGVTPFGKSGEREGRFWPDQLWRNALVFALTLAVLLVLSLRLGAPLSAPADPAGQFVARPEWYFLPLYQLLKYTEGGAQWVGTLLLPGLAAILLLSLPYFRRFLGFGVACALLLGALVLGLLAVREDARNPDLRAAALRDQAEAARARSLAATGVPPEGPRALLDADPVLRGRKVFAARCAKCHEAAAGPRKAPDLDGYLSTSWLTELLKTPDSERFFGATKARGQMESSAELGDERLQRLAVFLQRQGAGVPDPDGARVFSAAGCESCHSLVEGEVNVGPNLAGYGGAKWLSAFLDAPGGDLFYGEANDMPTFAAKLDDADRQAIIAYLRSLAADGASGGP
jgi:ubiquinol-cytochrome c reductase cytochrome b subunit